MFQELSGSKELPASFLEWVRDPVASLRKAADETGRTPVALLCPAIPTEIPWALNGIPFLVPAVESPGSLADSALQSFCCIRVRAVAEYLLDGRLGDRMAVANIAGSCDSLQNMSSVTRVLCPNARVSTFSLPIARRGEAAPAFVRSQLVRWSAELASFLGRPAPSEDELEESLFVWEELRSGLLDLEALTVEGRLNRSTYLAVSRASLMAEPERTMGWIDELKRVAEAASDLPDPDETVRMGIVAGPLDHLGIIADMEDKGAHFVWDDSCTGTTLAAARALGSGSPIDRLTRRFASEFICPVVSGSGSIRHKVFVEKMSSRSGRAALLLLWKFCDPHAFDNALFKRRFREQNIPYLELELDPVMSGMGQMQVRCEAFLESLTDI